MKLHKDTLESISKFETDTLDRIRRVNIAEAELEVRGPRNKGHSVAPELSDPWFQTATPVAE